MPTASAVKFFFDHAGYSYNTPTETAEQGRQRCAEQLAHAEEQGRDAGLSFHWERDQLEDDNEWYCACYNAEGETVASLAGVDFGDDGEPWGSTYRRVVEAELASEALQ